MSATTAFLLLLPFVLSPGASFALTVGGAALGDRCAGLRVAFGTAMGTALIAAVAGLSGLGDFVGSNASVRAWFEIIGGFVLITFGALPLIKAWAARSDDHSQARKAPPSRLVAWAFITVVTNVKALAIYIIVVPPALSESGSQLGSYAVVATVHIVMLFAWLGATSALITQVPAIATRPRVVIGLQLAASAMLLVMGVNSGASGFSALV